MRHPFRHFHTLQLLEGFDSRLGPLDRYLRAYFQNHRSLGSKDRAWIAQTTCDLVRHQRLLDQASAEPGRWPSRLEAFSRHTLAELRQRAVDDLALAESLSPQLFALLKASFSGDLLMRQCRLINAPAPIALRVNALMGDRERLLELLPSELGARPSSHCATGITLSRREALFTLDLFRQGWFEVQDEGSQLLTEQITAQPGDWIVDFCAGSGGKTLALAPKLQRRGQIFLGDVRPRALQEAKVRLKRAGVQNAQILAQDHPTWRRLKGRTDWLILDVPCSGSGTLRRHPDAKERIDTAMVARCVAAQREIFRQAFDLVKVKGRICYATCSLFRGENEDQVDHFLNHYPLRLIHSPPPAHIVEDGPDGFFTAIFERV